MQGTLTYSWSWALLEEKPNLQLLKNFPAFCGTQRFITVFTRAFNWSLSWARSIQSIPSYPISLRSIWIMSTFFSLCRLSKESVQVRGFLRIFVTSLFFYGELLTPRPTPKLEDHPLAAVCDCLFNIFAAFLHTWRASPPSATWGRAMPWWQRTQ
jgi:hypothetical protein